MKNNKGITIIVLVITVIIMLILLGVTITVAINGDLIGTTKSAKQETEKNDEKEKILVAIELARKFDAEKIQAELDKTIGENKTEVIPDGKEIVVQFKESNRNYKVYKNGNIEDFEIYIDRTPGTLSGEGTEENPYLIESIEDLVAFAKDSKNYQGNTVLLTRTLDFNSKFSYNESTTTAYGDLNEDGKIEGIQEELTKQEEGCKGFTAKPQFYGTFDGQEHEIRNIYENTTEATGLFAIAKGEIKNLGITGKMITTNTDYAGGICSTINGTFNIINCHTNINIIANSADKVGGMVGRGAPTVTNCYNLGDITAENGSAGGIVGYAGTLTIDKSYNEGKISGKYSGGILGYSYCGRPTKIINCYNTEKIYGTSYAGGILGYQNGSKYNVEIKNCYNIGNITGSVVGGILNGNNAIITTENCYNAGTLQGSVGSGGIFGRAGGSASVGSMLLHSYYLNTATSYAYTGGYVLTPAEATSYSISQIQSQDLVNELNNYISENVAEEERNGWCQWKLGKDNYPTLQY